MLYESMRSRPLQVALALAMAGLAPGTAAQGDANAAVELEEVRVLGSRRPVRTDASTPAPVDILSAEDLARQGSTDMNAMLRSLVPSYNVAAQPNQDEAAFIRPANLRNLPPDNTLVLVNGKRRHRGAVIAFLGSGVADGAQGPDISPIPSLALKQVQVLRDGAAPQYGSDAIAGVINFQLKDDAEGFALTARGGGNYDGDGAHYRLAANAGLPLSAAGFVNLSAEWLQAERTERQVQRGDAARLSLNNALIQNPAQTWGSPDIDNDFKFFANAGLNLSDNMALYALANYAEKTVKTVFFFRTPDGSDRPQRFSNDGGATVLVGDTNTANNIACPTIRIVNGNPTSSPGFEQIAAGGPLDRECFALAEVFPGGFTPVFGADVEDSSFAFGVRGELDMGLNYDISAHWGRSQADYFFINSVNPSFSNSVANAVISPGFNVQTDTNFNADLSYPLDIGLASDLNIAFGFEWREEEYEVGLGDPQSRDPGDLAGQGFRETVDGFAGFSTRAAGVFDRGNIALYVDLEADINDRWTLGGALRYEDFDDFGGTTNFKIASRVAVTDNLALRSTLSTGFRAPTPGQSNSVRTSTIVTAGGVLESGTLSPTDPLAIALAAAIPGAAQPKALEPEESISFTLGALFNFGEIDLAIDFFRIDIDDRITLGSEVPVGATLADGGAAAARLQAAIDALAAAGDSSARSISGFNFFVNDFATQTQGVDIVAGIPLRLGRGDSKLSVAYNHTRTEVTSESAFLSATRIFSIENGLPENRLTLTGTHLQGDWGLLLRGNYYGEIGVGNDLGRGVNKNFDGFYGGKFLVDAEIEYTFNENMSIVLGAQNVFDTVPDKVPQPENNAGQIYPEESPFGFNGGFYYLQFNYTL